MLYFQDHIMTVLTVLCIWICEFSEIYWLLQYFNIIIRYCTNINGQLHYKPSFRKLIFNRLIPAALISILFVSSFLSLGHEYCAISWGFGMCYSYITYPLLNLSAPLLCFKFFSLHVFINLGSNFMDEGNKYYALGH